MIELKRVIFSDNLFIEYRELYKQNNIYFVRQFKCVKYSSSCDKIFSMSFINLVDAESEFLK